MGVPIYASSTAGSSVSRYMHASAPNQPNQPNQSVRQTTGNYRMYVCMYVHTSLPRSRIFQVSSFNFKFQVSNSTRARPRWCTRQLCPRRVRVGMAGSRGPTYVLTHSPALLPTHLPALLPTHLPCCLPTYLPYCPPVYPSTSPPTHLPVSPPHPPTARVYRRSSKPGSAMRPRGWCAGLDRHVDTMRSSVAVRGRGVRTRFEGWGGWMDGWGIGGREGVGWRTAHDRDMGRYIRRYIRRYIHTDMRT